MQQKSLITLSGMRGRAANASGSVKASRVTSTALYPRQASVTGKKLHKCHRALTSTITGPRSVGCMRETKRRQPVSQLIRPHHLPRTRLTFSYDNFCMCWAPFEIQCWQNLLYMDGFSVNNMPRVCDFILYYLLT